MRLIKLSILAAIFFVSGCSTIISGSKQEMSFQTSPEGATVTVNGRILGKAPLTVQLDKKKDQTVIFSLDGHKPVTMQLTTRLDSWFWGNIVIGGFFGSTTDNVTGAMHEYSPSQYIVNLVPEKTSGLETHTVQSHQERVRGFVMLRYQNIVADLAKGGGNDVNSLLALLDAPKDSRHTAVQDIKKLSEATPDIYGFAEKVSQLKF
jgi:hypothetical protein